MILKEYIRKEIRNSLLQVVNEDRVNDFFYMDLKSHMWNRRKDYSNKIKKLNGLEKTEYLEDLYIKINGKASRDIKGNGIDLYKRLVNDKVIREDYELDQAFNKAKPVDEKSEEEKADYVKGYEPIEEKDSKRDYKKEYAKYGKSKKAKKYRAELNKYNRDKGTYGNGDGKDASHKGGKIVGFEAQSKNRGRREKSRLKKEATFVPNSGTMSGGVLRLDNRKYQLKKDIKNVKIGNTIVTLPKGTILYNIAGGLFADHKSLEQYETRNQRYFKKPTFRGIQVTQKTDTIKDIDKNSKVLESVNEGKFYITRNLGRGQGKSLVGGYDLKKDKKLPPKEFKSYKDAQKEVDKLKRGGSMGGQMTAYFVTDKDMNMLKPNGKKMFDNVNEQQLFVEKCWKGYKIHPTRKTKKLFGKTYPNCIKNEEEKLDEKLITFSNRAAYGQVVFMAGGAGSGKGFAKDNFIDAAGFKVRDVDEMKKQLGRLDTLGKFSVDKWYKKYGKNLSTKPPKKNPKGMSPKAHIEEFVLGKNLSISDISKDLKNPINVASLHYIVDAMKLKDRWLISMLSGKDNKETLPNLLFDITAKKVSSITDVIKSLMGAGYDSNNVHLIWVLTNYNISVERNKERERIVPDDILLDTHEGAGKTMWSILTKILPKGLNGRIDVILNNSENTIYHIQPTTRKGKKVGVVSDFVTLPIKKQGGGIIPEKVWKTQLYSWIRKNAPATLDIDQTINKDEEYMI